MSLRGNNSILILNLDYNEMIGDEGLEILCEGIRTNRKLEVKKKRKRLIIKNMEFFFFYFFF